MRWIAGWLGILLTFGLTLTGCKQQCFLPEDEFNKSHGLPPHLDVDPRAAVAPIVPLTPTPATVDVPERKPRYLSLPYALAMALENGTTGIFSGAGQGLYNEQLSSFNGSGTISPSFVGQSDAVRVLAMNPATAQANIEAALSRFDAHWVTAMNWSNTDNLQQGLNSFENGQKASFNTTLVKGNAYGGIFHATFETEYVDLKTPPQTGAFGVINPLYQPRLKIGLEQPLWRDAGVDINQLLNHLPSPFGATLPQAAANALGNSQIAAQQTPFFGGVTGEGILLARLRFDAHRAEFERQVQAMVVNVEVAYWRLYQSYGQLYANEEVMRLAHRTWMIAKSLLDTGKMAEAGYAPIRAQYEEFRGERIKSLGLVLEAERNLRGLLGLPVEDGERLVPFTPPTLAPYSPDWSSAVTDCMTHRPELVMARDNLRAAQFNLVAQLNFLKPDLRFFASYSPVGFGTRLDGSDTFMDGTGTPRTSNALRSLVSDHYNDWNLGLILNVPLGWRLEQAAVRNARINLAQSYHVLKDQETRAQFILDKEFKKISELYRRIEATRNERQAYAKAVDARFKKLLAAPLGGADKGGEGTYLDPLMESQRRLALAQSKEYEAIAEYNSSLARFEWSKGTILEHDNVMIAEGDLPTCAQVRAVEHERERSHALVVRERPNPDALRQPGFLAGHDPEPLPDETAPLPPGALPPGSLPPGALPPGSLPPGSMPPGSMPPGSMPHPEMGSRKEDAPKEAPWDTGVTVPSVPGLPGQPGQAGTPSSSGAGERSFGPAPWYDDPMSSTPAAPAPSMPPPSVSPLPDAGSRLPPGDADSPLVPRVDPNILNRTPAPPPPPEQPPMSLPPGMR